MAAMLAGTTAFASFGTMSNLAMTAFRRKEGMSRSIFATMAFFAMNDERKFENSKFERLETEFFRNFWRHTKLGIGICFRR